MVPFKMTPKDLSRCGMNLARLVPFNLVRMTPKDLSGCDMDLD